jgi:hypothetical protein
MSIPNASEYFGLVEKVRDEKRDDLYIIDDASEYIPSEEVNDLAANYMDTLRMERCKGEQPVYKLMPMPKPVSGKDMHVTADTIITLADCDGMNMEFLFLQPSHGEYLEDITKEVHGV